MMMDRDFEMPTATEPPRDPATPRPIDEARKQREDRAEVQREQDIRAQALAHSLTWATRTATNMILPDVFGVADDFAAYILNGAQP